MPIDFSFPEEIEFVIEKVRDFINQVVRPAEKTIEENEGDRKILVEQVIIMRKAAKEWGLWLPHMPTDVGGMGLGHVAMAAVSAEAAKTRFGPYALNAQAPDEGNMHTLYHWATDEQKEKYLMPLCKGTARSCFAMTEPEVAGSDPTLIQTKAVRDGDDWIINGHKWFISGAAGAQFAILIAKTEDNPEVRQAGNSAFLVDIPSEGWELVRDIETMSGGHNHCEIRITDLRVPNANMLGGLGEGHLLGQARLGPARLAHCMRWLGQAEVALEMMIDRATKRFSHGTLLSEKQGIQWMIADSTMEIYQSKLMILHSAYRIDRKEDFKSEVSMTKHFVANTLNRVIDRAIQVHGALGYSTDTPLAKMATQARWARLADGADEVHQWRIAQRAIDTYLRDGSVNAATGSLPL
ncbi:MAG: acyl-CoA dehydrogenase family protein [Myxococcales bacterium]|nr:acyl-CoA dehydrogenase family protein [Myxococcales bacterium]